MKIANLITVLLVISSLLSYAQDSKKSPAMSAEKTINGLTIKISYGSPAVKGRKVWGDLVPYGQVWRTGANEATTIELSKDAMIGGKKIVAGKYALFTIPNESIWVVILNSDSKQWGAYNYSEAKDVIRFESKPILSDTTEERLLFTIDNSGKVNLAWETLVVSFQIEPIK